MQRKEFVDRSAVVDTASFAAIELTPTGHGKVEPEGLRYLKRRPALKSYICNVHL